ncbi:hypothetical protein JQ628_23530 [Bradyrhizobium lablabi]|uniref:HGGxSTG domain-containing protein n=1 Tax=Bradyrhizobium lablabi TaxID=722472 RepID=UPI001BA93C4B|nr:HGGxSTG domain-containing protein [Bradyrhizobium lablabi]MBR1124518.1 hypothetical protein [Bradyrhizobium lablabi]
MARRRKTSQLDQWRKSGTFREIARQSAKANLRKFRSAPRCGAKRKRDGKPCANPAMKNGRCGIHGGKTPSGRQWHVVQYPADEAKFNRKLRDLERRAAKRAARLANLSPEARAAYDEWHRTHRSGLSKAARSAERERARQNADLRRLVAQGASQATTDPETLQIRDALSIARARLAELEARIEADKGVFG